MKYNIKNIYEHSVRLIYDRQHSVLTLTNIMFLNFIYKTSKRWYFFVWIYGAVYMSCWYSCTFSMRRIHTFCFYRKIKYKTLWTMMKSDWIDVYVRVETPGKFLTRIYCYWKSNEICSICVLLIFIYVLYICYTWLCAKIWCRFNMNMFSRIIYSGSSICIYTYTVHIYIVSTTQRRFNKNNIHIMLKEKNYTTIFFIFIHFLLRYELKWFIMLIVMIIRKIRHGLMELNMWRKR